MPGGGNGACSANPASEVPADEPAQENKDNENIVRQYIQQVWNGKNLAAIVQFVAADYVRHRTIRGANGTLLFGRDGLRSAAQQSFKTFPDLAVEIGELTSDCDKVMARLVVTGGDSGGLRAAGPTNKRVRVASMAVFRLANGRIAESWHLFDESTMLDQLTGAAVA